MEMSPLELDEYRHYVDAVQREIQELSVVLEALQARQNERQWRRNQAHGELDDARLVEGLTGEPNIYRQRREQPPEPFGFQALPKRITFLFDLSASMSRYSHDGRLQRSLEAAVMVMESFANFPSKVHYEIRGHSGDTDNLVLSQAGIAQIECECVCVVQRRIRTNARVAHI
jgi:hypothetical protein